MVIWFIHIVIFYFLIIWIIAIAMIQLQVVSLSDIYADMLPVFDNSDVLN